MQKRCYESGSCVQKKLCHSKGSPQNLETSFGPSDSLSGIPTNRDAPSQFSFDSKLISLLPLDEAPVHVPLRRPRPLRFERLRVGGEGKADANLTIFLSPCFRRHPKSPPHPG